MEMNLNPNGLLPLYLAYLVPATLANSFLALYLLTHLDVGLYGLIAYYLVAFCVGAAAVAWQGPIRLRTTFGLAAFMVAAEFIILAFSTQFVHALLAAVLYGLLMMYFWTAYNTRHFQRRTAHKNATISAHYYAVAWLAAVVLPLVGAFILNSGGFKELYVASAILALPLLFLALGFRKEKLNFNLLRELQKSRGYRTLTFFEGALSAMPLCILPALSVLYFPKPVEFGIYTAFVSLAAIAAAILLARHSDVVKKRRRFLAPLTLASAGALLGAFLANDVWVWTAATAAFSFVHAVCSPLRTAIVLDKEKRAEVAMSNREFLLNVGRVAALVVSGIGITLGQPQTAIVSGILAAIGYAVMLGKKEWIT